MGSFSLEYQLAVQITEDVHSYNLMSENRIIRIIKYLNL